MKKLPHAHCTCPSYNAGTDFGDEGCSNASAVDISLKYSATAVKFYRVIL
jgi:hypothetical protein